MFQPNLVGQLEVRGIRNVHGEASYYPATNCPFAFVNMAVAAQKTSVRADSSASRGSADEIAAERAKILVPAYVALKHGDRFLFKDMRFAIVAVHPRRSIAGILDHFEVDLEVLA